MVVRIRLARFGRKHAPIYNIVVAQARTARNSKPMEVIGTYDPIPKLPLDDDGTGRKYKDIQLDQARAKYWLGVGAQPSDPAWRLLAMVGLLEPKFRKGQGSAPQGSVGNREFFTDKKETLEHIGDEMNKENEQLEAAAV